MTGSGGLRRQEAAAVGLGGPDALDTREIQEGDVSHHGSAGELVCAIGESTGRVATVDEGEFDCRQIVDRQYAASGVEPPIEPSNHGAGIGQIDAGGTHERFFRRVRGEGKPNGFADCMDVEALGQIERLYRGNGVARRQCREIGKMPCLEEHREASGCCGDAIQHFVAVARVVDMLEQAHGAPVHPVAIGEVALYFWMILV